MNLIPQKIRKLFYNPFKIKSDDKSLTIKKDNEILISIINDENNNLTININTDVTLLFNKKVNILSREDIDVTTFEKDIKVDTWKGKLYLNSYNSDAIKDLEEAKQLRKQSDDIRKHTEKLIQDQNKLED
jgi:hypothetical protein